jgi:hypothetical protein
MPKIHKVSIARELGVYFELVELGKKLMISSLIEQGFTVLGAKREYARLHKERFARGDPPNLVLRAMKAGIWGRRL